MNPRVYRAPGRVNLIGENTDYNDGFVMPAAIGFYCWVAASPRKDRRLVFFLRSSGIRPKWDCLPTRCGRRIPGVIIQLESPRKLEKAGFALAGANLLICGEVPIGAGLSSSASIEEATVLALAEESGLSIDRTWLARMCQQAENDFVGMRCGGSWISFFRCTGARIML